MDEYLQQIGDYAQTAKDCIQVANQTVNLCEKSGGFVFNFLKFFGREPVPRIPSPERIRKMLMYQHFLSLKNDIAKVQAIKSNILTVWDNIQVELLNNMKKSLTDKNDISLEQVDEIEFAYDHVTEALKRKFNSTMEEFDAQEAVLTRAILRIAKNPASNEMPENTPEPSGTWRANFLNYISDLRDEDLHELWSRVLEGEMRKPGSFSLRTLDILHSLDTRDAHAFAKIAKHTVNGNFVQESSLVNVVGMDRHQLDYLTFLGLLLPYGELPLPGETVRNRHFQVTFPQNYLYDGATGYLLSPPAQELYTLVDISKEESLEAMRFFVDNKDADPVEIVELEQNK